MITKTVYLAGPIVSLTRGEANDWRKIVDAQLQNASEGQIKGVSPLRCEPIIGGRYTLEYDDPKFGMANAIGANSSPRQ